jgi:ABC-type uncharacterized transport system auxiliary subunit
MNTTNTRAPWVLRLAATLVAVLFLSGCQPKTTRETIVETRAEVVNRRVMQPVESEYTDELPCYERSDESVQQYIEQANTNTALCKVANVHRKAVKRDHGKPQ